MGKEMVVQDNTLINASYTISLTEQRLLLLSIAKAQKSGLEINHSDYITIHADEFVKAFNVNEKSVYAMLKDACTTLFRREFSYKEGRTLVQSHWLQSSKYHEDSGCIEILFAKELIPFISQLKKRFTSYFLEDVSRMSSVYAIRLYELIIAWRSSHKTPIFELSDLRSKLGVEPSEYPRMTNFKDRVLGVAIKQINDLSNIQITMEQHKKGRSIVGFSFEFIELSNPDRDPNTVDWVDEAPQEKPPKRKKISEQEACRIANPGEEWDDLLRRIGSKYHVVFDKNK